MADDVKYKYEVAFSFLQVDELIAYQINDLIQDRIETFLYSKKQEELGGTDGEKKFNEVFYKDSRIVVVLYRNGWGQTPWTRIEETAIKNKAFDKGWEFLLLVNLDKTSKLPPWIPKSYIWFDFERWKAEGLAPVIEQKVKECGGETRPDSIGDKAKRFQRLRDAVKERDLFLRKGDAILVSDTEVANMIQLLKESKAEIEDPATFLNLSTEERLKEMYQIGHDSYYLCFNWLHQYHEIKDRILVATIYEQRGHYGIRDDRVIQETKYTFDRALNGNNIWTAGTKTYISTELVHFWVSNFLDVLGTREKHRR